jgi:hypothetical protein
LLQKLEKSWNRFSVTERVAVTLLPRQFREKSAGIGDRCSDDESVSIDVMRLGSCCLVGRSAPRRHVNVEQWAAVKGGSRENAKPIFTECCGSSAHVLIWRYLGFGSFFLFCLISQLVRAAYFVPFSPHAFSPLTYLATSASIPLGRSGILRPKQVGRNNVSKSPRRHPATRPTPPSNHSFVMHRYREVGWLLEPLGR